MVEGLRPTRAEGGVRYFKGLLSAPVEEPAMAQRMNARALVDILVLLVNCSSVLLELLGLTSLRL